MLFLQALRTTEVEIKKSTPESHIFGTSRHGLTPPVNKKCADSKIVTEIDSNLSKNKGFTKSCASISRVDQEHSEIIDTDETSSEAEDSLSESSYVPTHSESESDSEDQAENWDLSKKSRDETYYTQKPVTQEMSNLLGNYNILSDNEETELQERTSFMVRIY